MEYLADRFPHKHVWPREIKARTFARVISNEMHAGFRGIRGACPMNLRKRYAPSDRGELVAKDVVRITKLWTDALTRFGGQGPFLFGSFCAADAMYAPVVTRFQSYSIAVDPLIRRYMDAVMDTASFSAWQNDAMQEPWIVAHDEIDEAPIGPFRP
jgi:glutathione S-transferase